MKKLFKTIALIFAFVLCFAACGDKETEKDDRITSKEKAETVQAETETEAKVDIMTEAQTQPPATEADKKGDKEDGKKEDKEDGKNEVTDNNYGAETNGIQNFIVPDGYDYEEVIIDENADRQKVKFTMKNGGSFIVELYPEYAPKTCENFVKLVEDGYYDGLTFHRVIPGFMAQGGDPTRSGRPDTAEEIYGEFYVNGHIKNTISHQRGVISMARTNEPNSASSQFFICYDDCGYSLDGAYAAFGIVTEGMDVVDGFLDVERKLGYDDAISEPVTPIVIAKAEVVK